MASFNKWYPAAEDQIVPWNARFTYPGQALPAVKTTPRIAPKNGSNFRSGNVIRLEFPAQGYVNPRNTTLAFDVYLTGYGTAGSQLLRFQNNIQSIFSRVRLMYGSTPLEDIINYNVITRNLTEWTANSNNSGVDGNILTDGIGQTQLFLETNGVTSLIATTQSQNARQVSHGIAVADYLPLQTTNSTGATSSAKRYTVQLNLGLFNQDKLIPVKFMASQLAIELTLANSESCIFVQTAGSGSSPYFEVQNVTLLPEILEFDSAYDAMFLKGLKEGGVPIKFSSWHTFQFNLAATTSANVQIQERSRSVRSIYTVQRISPELLTNDSGATLYSSNVTSSNTLQQYQYRIGGRYYPASPVQCALVTGGSQSNGAAEAYVELQKALHTLGDFRLSNSLSYTRWGYPYATDVLNASRDGAFIPQQALFGLIAGNATASKNGQGISSQAFCMAINLDTTDGGEICGINAEEQSDIILQAQWSHAQTSGYVLESYVYFDAMLIIRENNVVELIQ